MFRCSNRHKVKMGGAIINQICQNISRKLTLMRLRCFVFGRAHRDSAVRFLLLQRFKKGLAVEYSSCFNSVLGLDLYVCCFDAYLS